MSQRLSHDADASWRQKGAVMQMSSSPANQFMHLRRRSIVTSKTNEKRGANHANEPCRIAGISGHNGAANQMRPISVQLFNRNISLH